MTDAARHIDLPPEIADAMEAAGFSPKASTLMQIIADFKAAKLAAGLAAPESATEGLWPLKAIVPLHVRYEDARRAAVAGRLEAELRGGRWFCTKAAMARWAPTTRRGQRRR